MNLLAAVSSFALLGAQSQMQPQDVNYLPTALHEQLACAPQMLPNAPLAGIRVIGNHEKNRTMFGTGDALIIDAGNSQGIKPGQVYFVRRPVRDQFIGGVASDPDAGPVSIHTAGWVTVVDVKDLLSVARVTHACDGIIYGDYLEPFADPADPPAAVQGAPDYEHPGRIVMGDERRQMGSAGTLMVLDRGSDAEVRPGQTVTIYRETMGGIGPVYQVGHATVVSVRPQSAVVRIDATREAVFIGDRAAINRITTRNGG
jgi:hypothetical protein